MAGEKQKQTSQKQPMKQQEDGRQVSTNKNTTCLGSARKSNIQQEKKYINVKGDELKSRNN